MLPVSPAHAGIDPLNHLCRLKEALNGRESAGWATDWAKNYLADHPYPHSRLNLPDAPRPTPENQNPKEPPMTAAPPQRQRPSLIPEPPEPGCAPSGF